MNIDSYEKLPRSFYLRPKVVQIAQDLLGKYLFTNKNGQLTVGKIVETEAYDGRCDKACHAFLKRTKRTEIMYQEGGIAYVYLCYGIHHLFNIVTNEAGLADAVLVRGIEPVMGEGIMLERRNGNKNIGAGPGVLTQALEIKKAQTGIDLTGEEIWIASENDAKGFKMITDIRIGIDYAEEDAFLPWRFYIDGNPWVSKRKRL
ncbi:MAG: DNA-3-methyladenine glycosylase [Cyclobacteriaceae bacterium]|jgi:DNA-3-methyladenine glycosylase